MFFGSIPALVTPFAAGRVNEAAFRDLIEWQVVRLDDSHCRVLDRSDDSRHHRRADLQTCRVVVRPVPPRIDDRELRTVPVRGARMAHPRRPAVPVLRITFSPTEAQAPLG